MTIQELLRKYHHPETELLLGNVLKQSKEFLYLHPEQRLSQAQLTKFKLWLSKRKSDYPLAYLRGYKDFYGLRFKVNRHTLIPRPESEWLVKTGISLIKNSSAKIIDVGTGSGCIAISLAKHLPKANISAVDISGQALAVAKRNAKLHGVKINFFKQYLLKDDDTRYDLIVANLPYVPKADYLKLKRNLRFEPSTALIDPIADFNLYEELLSSVQDKLTKRGVVLLEIDPSMKTKLIRYCRQHLPLAKIDFTSDHHRLVRFAKISFA